MKRLFDMIFSLIGLLILFPLFLFIALFIWLDDHGPVFFSQERIGKNKRIFMIYKFRSMKQENSSTKGRFEPGDKSRITRAGNFLRRKKLDELPQLYNVLIGDMSIVGPRPEIQKWVEAYPDRWTKVLSVRPGITDNASIAFRDEEDMLAASENPIRTYQEYILPEKLNYYENYVDNHTFPGDISLILRTILCKK